jgi:hypothetical protein
MTSGSVYAVRWSRYSATQFLREFVIHSETGCSLPCFVRIFVLNQMNTLTNILRVPFVFLQFRRKYISLSYFPCVLHVRLSHHSFISVTSNTYWRIETSLQCRSNCVDVCYLLLVANNFFIVFRHPQFVFLSHSAGHICVLSSIQRDTSVFFLQFSETYLFSVFHLAGHSVSGKIKHLINFCLLE